MVPSGISAGPTMGAESDVVVEVPLVGGLVADGSVVVLLGGVVAGAAAVVDIAGLSGAAVASVLVAEPHAAARTARTAASTIPGRIRENATSVRRLCGLVGPRHPAVKAASV